MRREKWEQFWVLPSVCRPQKNKIKELIYFFSLQFLKKENIKKKIHREEKMKIACTFFPFIFI